MASSLLLGSRSASIVLGAYALGCVIGAYYLVRIRTGQDLRSLGSGNAGATNAGRLLGRSAFITALLIDAGKGALVVLGARALGASGLVVALAIVAVACGHVWPAQLGFRGGKGAATALGVLIAFDVRVLAILVVVAAVVIVVTRRYEVAGSAALVVAPVAAGLVGFSTAEVAGLTVLAAIVAMAHRLYATRAVEPATPPLSGLRETHATS